MTRFMPVGEPDDRTHGFIRRTTRHPLDGSWTPRLDWYCGDTPMRTLRGARTAALVCPECTSVIAMRAGTWQMDFELVPQYRPRKHAWYVARRRDR